MNRRYLILALTVLAGCAATGPTFKEVENTDPGSAIVYVYRDNSLVLGVRPAYFYVNKVNVFDLQRSGYSWVSLPPGRYTLHQQWPIDLLKGPLQLDIDVRAGDVRYFSFQTRLDGCPSGYPQTCALYELREQPSAVGRAVIADKHFEENFGLEKLKQQAHSK